METGEATQEKKRPDAAAIVAHYLPYDYPPEWMEYVKAMNLPQRIHGAIADIKPMKKDRMMDGGQQKFAYHGHAAITAQCKAVFEKWRIAISSTVLEESHEPITIGKYATPGYFTTAKVRVTFINIDDPEDQCSSDHVGYGQDTSDKGIGKAVTYATKYGMMKCLMISDGEEPDNESVDWDAYDEDQGRKQKAAPRQSRQEKAQEELRRAEESAGMAGDQKPASKMRHGEIFAAIITQLQPMGADKDSLGLYLKNHDRAKALNDVPIERMHALYAEATAKRNAYDTVQRVIDKSGDREGAEARLAALFENRSVFAVSTDELYKAAEEIQGAAA